jgi:hypothetical protein
MLACAAASAAAAAACAGTTQLLAAASAVFRQQGVALAAQKAHSSYQRSIAGTLARLRVMHVLEDSTTGGEQAGVCRNTG